MRSTGKGCFSSLLPTEERAEIAFPARMAFHLPSVLKALLFSSGQPLTTKEIQAVFARYHDQHAPKAPVDEGTSAVPTEGEPTATQDAAETEVEVVLSLNVPTLVTAAEIREAMEAVSRQLEAAGDVYLLDESAKGYRIVTNPDFAPWVRALRDEPPPARLSPSSLETLAVVAYRQPVTRSEIETVRGVSADAGLNKLLERELIYITGRAELPGRPLQYSTTDNFLEFVGVKSLVELPASDVLSPRQIDEWLNNAMNPTKPGDAEMGLPLEEGEGDSPMADEAHIEKEAAAESPTAEAIKPVPAMETITPEPAEESDAPATEGETKTI